MGTGGHAKVIADMLIRSEREIIGFVSKEIEASQEFAGSIILGGDDCVYKFPPEEIELANGIGALPGKSLRWKIAKKMRKKGYTFTTVVHPSAIIAKDVEFSEGVQVMAGVVIQPGTYIGRDTIVNTGTKIDHDCTVGENCHVAPGVICSGGIIINSGSHIGTGTIIIQGVTLGERSLIAAGSVVHRDVLSDTGFMQKKDVTETDLRNGIEEH